MKKFWTFVIALIIGIVAGQLATELVRLALPTGVVRDFLTFSVSFGFNPITLDLAAIKITFGLMFSMSIIGFLIIVLIVYYFKWWI
ncbi:DUF4321 domain-containing protein [bacterium]|nr:DUF4321 domain-containing protein [bacterium]